ncbi:MAG: thiamine diphosphokinase [Tenericutes bacterium]|jgi:thiamine pyrophosphokinase|nr:thiamine diphosphokinase [Mycoplasmatota bacterium]
MFDKIKIFSGPNDYDFNKLYFEEVNEFIVGVDSGLEYLLNLNKEIDLAVGDFDSIDPEIFEKIKSKCKNIIQLDIKKNKTDLAYALDYIYNHYDYKQIEVYGGISGRVDHFIANLNLMKKYRFSLKDSSHYMYILDKGSFHIENYKKYISFFAIEDVYGLQLKGFKYTLDNYFLSTSDSLSVSNEGSGDVTFNKGKLLVIMSED